MNAQEKTTHTKEEEMTHIRNRVLGLLEANGVSKAILEAKAVNDTNAVEEIVREAKATVVEEIPAILKELAPNPYNRVLVGGENIDSIVAEIIDEYLANIHLTRGGGRKTRRATHRRKSHKRK